MRPFESFVIVRLLNGFAMKIEVETLNFNLFADPQTHGHVDQFEDDKGANAAPDERSEYIIELDQQLAEVAVKKPTFGRGVDGV